MAGENGATKNDLMAALKKAPYGFDFFHALRLIECAYPEKPLIGQSKRPIDDPVRFGQEVSLAFESSTLSKFIPSKDGKPARLNQLFLGLFGPNGPMPLHFTEYVKIRQHNFHDHTLARFADVFHHRMIGLYYRARANAEPAFSFDRPEQNQFASYVGAFAGIANEAMLKRDDMPDLAKVHYVGLFSAQAKNADGLIAILTDFFKLPVKLDELIGEWLSISLGEQTRLGESPVTGQLGNSVVLGSKVWSCQHKFRVVFGPLSLDEYQSLLPAGKRLQTLVAIVQNYVGFEFNWDVNLVLRKEQVPMASLDGNTRLGWTSWVGQRLSSQDADDLMLNPLML